MWRWRLSVGTTIAGVCAAIAAAWAALSAGGTGGLHPVPRTIPFCACEDENFALDEGIARCQLASDFLIALAYFSIPLELVYFFLRANVFPHRWVLLQFGLFIVFCGLTHLVNIWTYGPHPRSIALLQTVLKVFTAAVSCATAFLLVTIIPALLDVKVRELFLQHKASQLDRQMDVMKKREEAGRRARMLTSHIRQTLDRHTILNTTLHEITQALGLDNCTIWMPVGNGTDALELTHELERRLVQVPVVIPLTEPTVQAIVQTDRAMRIAISSPLGKASMPRGTSNCSMAAIRIPILPVDSGSPEASLASHKSGASLGAAGGTSMVGRGSSNDSSSALVAPSSEAEDVSTGTSEEGGQMEFGILVVVLKGDLRRPWRSHEVEMMEVVADQVAIALCHAAVLEESQRRQEELLEKNYALDVARERAEMAVRARNDFLTVMNHELRTPLHDIIGLVSLLQLEEEAISSEQRRMLGLAMRSSRLMCSMVRDVLAFSQMEENLLVLEHVPFDLHELLRDVPQLSWPLAHSRGLSFTYSVVDEVPQFVVGDQRRLQQMALNVIGRAVECTPSEMFLLYSGVCGKQGSVTVKVEVAKDNKALPPPNAPRPSNQQPWELVPARDFFVLRMEITDTGLGHAEGEASEQFQVFGRRRSLDSSSAEAALATSNGDGKAAGDTMEDSRTEDGFRGSGLSLVICQKFAEMMGGSICISSQGRGQGSTVSFSVQLERDTVGEKRHGQRQQQRQLEGMDAASASFSEDGLVRDWDLLDSYIADLEGLHVMVVEDNPANKKTARHMLERLCCRVTAVDSAPECLEWLSKSGASNAVDVVLLDICMPGIDGFDISRKICTMFRADERPLLLGLTARTNSGMREACLNAGMDGVLFKPITLMDLGSALCEVLSATA